MNICCALDVIAAFRSDPGCQRNRNEDAAMIVRPSSPDIVPARGLLAVVADGMGGHAAGDVASRTAVEVICSRYYQIGSDWRTALVQAIQHANAEILEQSRTNDDRRNMGTTCTALAIRDGFAWCGHVGDSRLYLSREGQIYAMTETHSAVMEQVRQGLLTPEEARRHEDRNVILRSLGSRPDVSIDTWDEAFPIRKGDRFILCTDGLYEVVSDFEINAAATGAEPADAVDNLIALARQRGAPDNVTVMILAVRDSLTSEPAKETRGRLEL
jgi:protein phosphatase